MAVLAQGFGETFLPVQVPCILCLLRDCQSLRSSCTYFLSHIALAEADRPHGRAEECCAPTGGPQGGPVREKIATEFASVLAMAGLDPSKGDLQGMNVLEDAYKYLGVDNALKEAIEATMGKLRQFKDVVLADESTWMADVQALKVIQVAAIPEAAEVGTAGQPGHVPARPRQPAKDRRLNTLESGQVGALRRISRLRLNLPAAEEVAPTGMGAGLGASSQAQQASPAPQAIVATLITEPSLSALTLGA